MNQKLSSLILSLSLLAGCQAGSSGDSKKPQASTDSTKTELPPTQTNTPLTTCANTVGSLTGDAKCWKKMLDTPDYLKCKSEGKIFNRIKKQCVDNLSMTRIEDSSKISEAEIKKAQDAIVKELPKAYITLDQCGTYTLGGKNYAFAYVMGQQFSESTPGDSSSAKYEIRVRSICYYPDAQNASVCNDEILKVSNPAPAMSNPLGSCD